jgi:hypothetical protein
LLTILTFFRPSVNTAGRDRKVLTDWTHLLFIFRAGSRYSGTVFCAAKKEEPPAKREKNLTFLAPLQAAPFSASKPSSGERALFKLIALFAPAPDQR